MGGVFIVSFAYIEIDYNKKEAIKERHVRTLQSLGN